MLATVLRCTPTPDEPYVRSVGLTPPECIESVRLDRTADEARAYCNRPHPNRH